MRQVIGSSLLFIVIVLLGCSTTTSAVAPEPIGKLSTDTSASDSFGVVPSMLVFNAHIELEVENVAAATQAIEQAIATRSGHLQHRQEEGEQTAQLTLRVPSRSLQEALDEIAVLGKVKERRVSSEDITDNYVNLAARGKNLAALSTRLTALLERAEKVDEILRIELEIARVQGEIDSMEARLASIKDRAEFSTVEVRLDRRRIYGPVAIILRGLAWGVGKLFVIR